jgi:hypothetical protein
VRRRLRAGLGGQSMRYRSRPPSRTSHQVTATTVNASPRHASLTVRDRLDVYRRAASRPSDEERPAPVRVVPAPVVEAPPPGAGPADAVYYDVDAETEAATSAARFQRMIFGSCFAGVALLIVWVACFEARRAGANHLRERSAVQQNDHSGGRHQAP